MRDKLSRRRMLATSSVLLTAPLVRIAWAQEPAFTADLHCHNFNAYDVPIEGFLERLAIGAGTPKFVVGWLKDYISELAASARSLAKDYPEEKHVLDGLLAGASWNPGPASPDLPAPTTELLIERARESARRSTPFEAFANGSKFKDRAGKTQDAEEELTFLLQLQAESDPEVREWIVESGGKVQMPGVTKKVGATPQTLIWAAGSKGWLRSAFDKLVGSLLGGTRFVSRMQASRLDVTAQLARTFPEVQLFTPALVDFDLWSSGQRARVPMRQQVELQEKLARLAWKGKILPNRTFSIHGFVGFNPQVEAADPKYLQVDGDNAEAEFRRWDADTPRPDAGVFDVVRDAIENRGFIGVKLYPPNGFVPWANREISKHMLVKDTRRAIDLVLRRLYRWCDEKGVPLLVHTGQSNLYDKSYRDYPAPARWIPVLTKYRNLRISLGHFGGDATTTTDGTKKFWDEMGASLAETFPGRVYFDISNAETPLEAMRLARLSKRLLSPPNRDLRNRLLYGTDFFMCDLVGDVAGYRKRLVKQIADDPTFSSLGPDFPGRFFGENARVFLGIRTDAGTPVDAALEGNRKRLMAWYGPSAPSWL